MSNLTPCVYQEKCSGCQLWQVPYSQHSQLKLNHFKARAQAKALDVSHLSDIEVIQTQPQGVRNRLDFSWIDGNLGLYSKPIQERKILDISHCVILTDRLNIELEKLRKLPWKFTKASFRLRESPAGLIGLWIDAANIEIKNFLNDSELLEQLKQTNWIIEIGQKKKELDLSRSRLIEQNLRPWNETQFKNQQVPLYGVISGFAQPSYLGQQVLRGLLETFLKDQQFAKAVEFGSGNGNWSFPLLQHCQELTVCEQDETALKGFATSLSETDIDLTRVKIQSGDFHRKSLSDDQFEIAFVNPARSGLKSFTQQLLSLRTLEKIIYVSCYPDSFLEDVKQLSPYFKIKKVNLVDQFPQTEHYEIFALLERVEL